MERLPTVIEGSPRARSIPREGVAWQDLLVLSWPWRVYELTMPLPWLALSLVAYDAGWTVPGVVCSFYFFLTALRLAHGCYHRTVVGDTASHAMLYVLSPLMVCAQHSIRQVHLRHHTDCMKKGDVEGAAGKKTILGVLAYGLVFPFLQLIHGWRQADGSNKGRILVEIGLMALWGGVIWVFVDWLPLKIHFSIMACGHLLTAFFAVWTVHHDCTAPHLARSQQGRVKNLLSYNMFLHEEHHRYPAVPTSRLPEVSERMRRALPKSALKDVY